MITKTARYREVLSYIESGIDELKKAKDNIENAKMHQGKTDLKRGFNEIWSALVEYGEREVTAEEFYLERRKKDHENKG